MDNLPETTWMEGLSGCRPISKDLLFNQKAIPARIRRQGGGDSPATEEGLCSVENEASCCFWSIGFRNFFQLLSLEPRRITLVVQDQAIKSAVSANQEPGRQRQLLGDCAWSLLRSGSGGVGKTHWAAGICRSLIALDRSARFFSGTALVQECTGPLRRPQGERAGGARPTTPCST